MGKNQKEEEIMKLYKILMLLGITMCNAAQWKNWAKNQQCSVKLVKPKTVEELKAEVLKAKKEGAPIRAYGAGHSWSNIVCTHGYVINTDNLNKIISIDLPRKQVTVQAGIKIKELNKYLAKKGLCLPNQSAITEQSLAGVVSTATHGSGKTGTFASFVTQVELLTADGTLKTISAQKNSDLWPAVRTSIGSLGIITSCTVQCVPLFKVTEEIRTTNWQDMVDNHEQWLEKNDFMQCYWHASDDSIEVTMHNRIPEKTNENIPEKIKNFFTSNSGYSYKMLSGTLHEIYMEEEIAVPRVQFIQTAQAVKELFKKEPTSKLFTGILFRFVSAEKDNILSPASNQNVVFFSAVTYQTDKTQEYQIFFKHYYDLLISFGGRPHWGKINFLTKEAVKKLYGNNFDTFIQIRKQLDPEGLFSNDFTKRIFGW